MSQRLYSICSKSLRVITLFITAFLFFANVYFKVEVSYDATEQVSISCNVLQNAMLLFPVLILIGIFYILQKQMLKINHSRLFIVLALFYILLAAYFVFNSSSGMRADARLVYKAALRVKDGDYSDFRPSSYMYTYPHQLGLMLFDLLVTCFCQSPSFLFFVNALLVIGINFTTWQTSRLLSQDPRVHLLTILLSFMFIPQLFFIMFAYGQIPGLFFLMIGIYNTIKYIKVYRLKNFLCLLVALTISVILRKNNLIGVCAVLIFLFLHWLKKDDRRPIITATCLVLSLFISSKVIVSYFEHKADVRLDNGCPPVLWIAMGTDIDNRTLGAGWYDSSSYEIYMSANADATLASALGWEKLNENMVKMQHRVTDMLRFFMDKIVSQWCEPLYQSVWSGPIIAGSQETYTSFLQSLYSGGIIEDYIENYSKWLSLLLYIGMIAFSLLTRKEEAGWEIVTAYFIGGFLFHLLWEAKSQYIYPYVFCLIPLSSHGIISVITHIGKQSNVPNCKAVGISMKMLE